MRSEEDINADFLFEQSQARSDKDFMGTYFRWRGATYSKAKLDAAIRQAVSRDDYVRHAATQRVVVPQPIAVSAASQAPLVIVALKIIAWMDLIGSLLWLFILENKLIAINLIVLSIVGFIMLYAFATAIQILWEIRERLSANPAAASRQNRIESQ